jgi:hypothetical protein
VSRPTVDEHADAFVRTLTDLPLSGVMSARGEYQWRMFVDTVKRAYKLGYAQGVQDAGLPAREHP